MNEMDWPKRVAHQFDSSHDNTVGLSRYFNDHRLLAVICPLHHLHLLSDGWGGLTSQSLRLLH